MGRRQTPDWWREAQELRASGLSLSAVARRLGRNHTSIKYACERDWRDKQRAINLRRSTEWYGRFRKGRYTPELNLRRKLTSLALEEARELGCDPDTVLASWGEPARYQWRRADV